MTTETNPNARAAPLAAADPAQVAEVNRVGLKVLRADAAAGRTGLPAAVRELRGEWAALDDAAIARAACSPFLLFAVDLDGALRASRAGDGEAAVAVAAPSLEAAGLPYARPAGRAFARMAVHYAWYVSTAAPAAAPMALGLPAQACERLRGLGLERVSALAEGAEQWVQLRWADDPRAWAERLQAACSGDPGALWASTLVGLQRLAGGLARAGR
jgi:hypothetical protein